MEYIYGDDNPDIGSENNNDFSNSWSENNNDFSNDDSERNNSFYYDNDLDERIQHVESDYLTFTNYVLDDKISIDEQDLENIEPSGDNDHGDDPGIQSYIKMDFLDSSIKVENNDCEYLHEILRMLNNENPIRGHRLESIRKLNIKSFYDNIMNKQYEEVYKIMNNIIDFNKEIANKLENYGKKDDKKEDTNISENTITNTSENNETNTFENDVNSDDKNNETNIINIFNNIIRNGFILTNSADCLFNNTFGVLIKLCNYNAIKTHELIKKEKHPDLIKPVENFDEVLNTFVKNDEEINTKLNDYYKNTLYKRFADFQTKDDIRKNLIQELSNGLINGLNKSGFLITKERIKLQHEGKEFESNYGTFYKSRFNKFIKECVRKIVNSINIDETSNYHDDIYKELMDIATKNNDNISNFLLTALNYILYMMEHINYTNFLIYHFQFFLISILIGYYFMPNEIFDIKDLDIETTYFNPSPVDRLFTMKDIIHIKIPDKSIRVDSKNISYDVDSKTYLLKNINVYLEVFTLINTFLFPNLKTIYNVFNEHINEFSFEDFSINYIKPYENDHVIVVANYGNRFYIADDELYKDKFLDKLNDFAKKFMFKHVGIFEYYKYLYRVFKEEDIGFCCFKGNKLVNFIYTYCFKNIITYISSYDSNVLNFISTISLHPKRKNVIIRQVYGSNAPKSKTYGSNVPKLKSRGGIVLKEMIKLILQFVVIISIIVIVVLVIQRIINQKTKGINT